MRLLLLAIVGFGLMQTSFVIARPVSYPGGWTLMTMNDGDKNSVHVHYSPTAKTSIGYKFEYWPDKELNLHALQINKLLKRWNKRNLKPISISNLELASLTAIWVFLTMKVAPVPSLESRLTGKIDDVSSHMKIVLPTLMVLMISFNSRLVLAGRLTRATMETYTLG